jgi:lipid II:glycine glycyltransferase (peptidoglycan interpeptide bridge formation enzyme)
MTEVNHQGQPAAAGLLIHHGNTTEIPSASTIRHFNQYSVNMALYWECIKLAIERGSTHFDFGRCTIGSGTHSFRFHMKNHQP